MYQIMKLQTALPADRNPVNVYIGSLSPGSRRTMISALENIAQTFKVSASQFDWTALRYQHVQAIRSKLLETYAPSTANRHLAALRGVLMQCWRLGYIDAEEYQKAIDFKTVKGSREQAGRYIEAEEVEKLIKHCYERNTVNGIRDAAIIGVLYVCGLRRAELVALRLSDYMPDYKLKIIGKGNKERRVQVNKQLQSLLKEWFELRKTSFSANSIFLNVYTGEPLTEQAIYTMLERRGKAVGIEHLSPHDFRHTFISNLFDAGVDISTIKYLSGHENVETTQRYDRRSQKIAASAVELLKIPGIKE